MNAGYLSPDHWVHGREGGGRLIGEASHLLDLFRFLAGAPAMEVAVTGIASTRRDVGPRDNFTLTVRYGDGSVCTLLYTAQGSRKIGKEYLEVFVDGHTVVLDDYRRLLTYGWRRDLTGRTQDKGHRAEWQAFEELCRGTRDRDAVWEEALEVSRLAVEADRLARGIGG
jgi:predicted dehydrogenase